MVHPVRSVGEGPSAVHYLVLDAPLGLRWRLAGLGRICISWHRLARVLAMLDRGWVDACADHVRTAWPVCQPTGPPHLSPVCISRDSLISVDRWQPWPARAPFADETDRWWPSHELPPIPQPPEPPGDAIRPVPEFPLYPAHAGLLNVLA